MGALTLVLSEQSVQACEVMVTLLLALLLLASTGVALLSFHIKVLERTDHLGES